MHLQGNKKQNKVKKNWTVLLRTIRVDLHSIGFSSVFLRVCFSVKKYALFHPHFYMSISALTRQSYTGQKFSKKIFFVKGCSSILNYRYYRSYTNIFEQTFYLYITVYLVRIRTYKNADEKDHTSGRSKNGRKTDTV